MQESGSLVPHPVKPIYTSLFVTDITLDVARAYNYNNQPICICIYLHVHIYAYIHEHIHIFLRLYLNQINQNVFVTEQYEATLTQLFRFHDVSYLCGGKKTDIANQIHPQIYYPPHIVCFICLMFLFFIQLPSSEYSEKLATIPGQRAIYLRYLDALMLLPYPHLSVYMVSCLKCQNILLHSYLWNCKLYKWFTCLNNLMLTMACPQVMHLYTQHRFTQRQLPHSPKYTSQQIYCTK